MVAGSLSSLLQQAKQSCKIANVEDVVDEPVCTSTVNELKTRADENAVISSHVVDWRRDRSELDSRTV